MVNDTCNLDLHTEKTIDEQIPISKKKDTGSYNCTSGRYIPSATVIVLSIDNTIIEVNNKQATINTCYLLSIDRIVLFTTYLVCVSTCTCLRNVTLFKIPNLTSF